MISACEKGKQPFCFKQSTTWRGQAEHGSGQLHGISYKLPGREGSEDHAFFCTIGSPWTFSKKYMTSGAIYFVKTFRFFISALSVVRSIDSQSPHFLRLPCIGPGWTWLGPATWHLLYTIFNIQWHCINTIDILTILQFSYCFGLFLYTPGAISCLTYNDLYLFQLTF